MVLALLTCALAGCATAPVAVRQQTAATRTSLLFRQAEHTKDPAHAAGLYLSAAEQALSRAAQAPSGSAEQTRAVDIYDGAVAGCVTTLQRDSLLSSAKTLDLPGAWRTYHLRITPGNLAAVRNPADFYRLVDSRKVFRAHLRSDVQRPGLGAAFVGVTKQPGERLPNQPPFGFATPLTAVAAFAPRKDATAVDLTFYDPRARDSVTLDRAKFPLKGDFTAPVAFFPRKQAVLFGFASMLFSDRSVSQSGIFFVEPYDPNKIPILFVHGLMSSPHAWLNFINELNRDPNFRAHYQPWVMFYPSGGPIVGNALLLRDELARIAQHYPLKHNLVIVGHSMGGIITRMQVTNTGRQLWDALFKSRADREYAAFPSNSIIKRALIFTANPYVSRVVFFSAPHRGSDLANLRIALWVGSLIRMPATLLSEFDPRMRAAMQDIFPKFRSIPNSIMGLSPRNPTLKALSPLPIQVPYHSIIGNQGQNQLPLAKTSDGIVPYWSSHLDGAQSELIVPTGHDSFDCPQSVQEMLRILAIKN